ARVRRGLRGLCAAGARSGRRTRGVDHLHPHTGARGVRGLLLTARGGGCPMRRRDTMRLWKTMTRSHTRTFALATLCAGIALLTGCHHETIDLPPMAPQVVVIRPQRGEAVRSITLPGDAVGYYQSALYAKVTGYLKNILVDKGDRVKKGQVLANIEVPELRQRLDRARSNLHIQQLSYERLERVWKDDPRLVARE